MNRLGYMTDDDYSNLDAIRNSDLGHLLKSPRHYWVNKYDERKDTDAFKFGRLFHMAILEPDLFATKVMVAETDKRTKAYKELVLANPDKTIITEQESSMLTGMSNTLRTKETWKQISLNAEREVAFTNQVSEVLCKCKCDLIVGDVIIDLKTTVSASEKSFLYSINDYGYHRQAAFYKAVTGAKRFLFVAIEKSSPYECSFFELDDSALAEGAAQYEYALSVYKQAVLNDDFHGYHDALKKLSLPEYKKEYSF